MEFGTNSPMHIEKRSRRTGMKSKEMIQMPKGIIIQLPDETPMVLTYLTIDFTGTLSLDGKLLPGVAQSLKVLSKQLKIIVLTSDTFGSAKTALQGLPVELRLVKNGKEKKRFVQGIDSKKTVAIGNGRNDVGMFQSAALGIAVAGSEGCSSELISVSDILVFDIQHAFDLLKHSLRIKATLRK
jgi:P-type E1-E2 ATPase